MGIATTTTSTTTKTTYPYTNKYFSNSESHNSKSSNSMSQQDYHHQNIFSFSNGFERSQQEQQQIAQQIHRDHIKLRPYEPPLVAMEEEPSTSLPVYESAGMLSEMFNFPPPPPPPPPTAAAVEWYGNSSSSNRQGDNQMAIGNLGSLVDIDTTNKNPIPGINADSAAAMQLFLMNPQRNSTRRSQSPGSTSLQGFNIINALERPTTTTTGSSRPSGLISPQQNFTWIQDHVQHEGQGLSLSLSTSLERDFDKAAAVEEAHGHVLLYNYSNNQASGGVPNASHQYYKEFVGHRHFGLGGLSSSSSSPPSFGLMNVLRNSKYARPTQELLEEFCSVGRGQLRRTKFGGNNSTNPSGGGGTEGGGGGGSSSTKDPPRLSATDRIEHQRRKVKLLSMLDEACTSLLSIFFFY